MSKTINPDELNKALMDYLKNYTEDINEEVKETTDEVIKDAKKELIKISPRSLNERTNKYYKGWAIKNSAKTRKGKIYGKVVWNKTNYQLTHLLEFGHATRNGSRTEAQPHIRPTEEKFGAQFVDLLEKNIRRISE